MVAHLVGRSGADFSFGFHALRGHVTYSIGNWPGLIVQKETASYTTHSCVCALVQAQAQAHVTQGKVVWRQMERRVVVVGWQLVGGWLAVAGGGDSDGDVSRSHLLLLRSSSQRHWRR